MDAWARDIADRRVHGTTGETPIERFYRVEAGALRSIAEVPPFEPARELVCKVQANCVIEVDSNAYSVPWRLIGESVQVVVSDGRVWIRHADQEVATHAETSGRRQRIVDPSHFHGVAGAARPVSAVMPAATVAPQPALLRPLAEYERAAGGGWS